MQSINSLTHAAPPRAASKAPSVEPAELPTPQDTVELGSHRSGWKMAGLGLLALAGAAAVSGCAGPNDTVVTDFIGIQEGHVDTQGRFYEFGNPFFVGRLTESGQVKDPLGLPMGSVSEDGAVKGIFLPAGRVTADGTVKDVLGIPVGKVRGSDPDRIEFSERAGAALLLLHDSSD